MNIELEKPVDFTGSQRAPAGSLWPMIFVIVLLASMALSPLAFMHDTSSAENDEGPQTITASTQILP